MKDGPDILEGYPDARTTSLGNLTTKSCKCGFALWCAPHHLSTQRRRDCPDTRSGSLCENPALCGLCGGESLYLFPGYLGQDQRSDQRPQPESDCGGCTASLYNLFVASSIYVFFLILMALPWPDSPSISASRMMSEASLFSAFSL